jgi:hypothetical protein
LDQAKKATGAAGGKGNADKAKALRGLLAAAALAEGVELTANR